MSYIDRFKQSSVVWDAQGLPGNHLVDLLLIGIDKEGLEEVLRPYVSSPQALETLRMNLIGGLRNIGYQVTGGRSGGKIYRVVGWEEPTSEPGVDSWSDEDRGRLGQIFDLPAVDLSLFNEIRRLRLDCSSDRADLHESSTLKILTYDLARDIGWLYSDDHHGVVIIRRNISRPVFKILNLNGTFDQIVEAVNLVTPISVKPVRIIDIEPSMGRELKSSLGGDLYRMEEVIYSTESLANMSKWSKSSASEIRRRSKDLTVEKVIGAHDAQTYVIDCWRFANEERQRQMSIVRDYRSIEIEVDSKRSFLGFRGEPLGGVPVGLQNFEIVRPDFAVMLTEKAFNRSSDGMPFGRPSTTDGIFIQSARSLLEEGVQWIQGGQTMGGNSTLRDHKVHLSDRIVYSTDLVTSRKRES